MKIGKEKILHCIFISMFLILSYYTNAQTSYFIVERPGTVKNLKYVEGNQITLMFDMDGKMVISKGRITAIKDSAIVINTLTKIPLNTIREVYKERKIMSMISGVGLMAGAGYFAIDGVNGLLTKRAPVIPVRTLFITGGLLATSLTTSFFTMKTMKTDGIKWRVKTLVSEL